MHLIIYAWMQSSTIPGSGFAGPPFNGMCPGVFSILFFGPPFTTPHPPGGHHHGGGARTRDHLSIHPAHGGGLVPRTMKFLVHPHLLTPSLAQSPTRPRPRPLPPCAARRAGQEPSSPSAIGQQLDDCETVMSESRNRVLKYVTVSSATCVRGAFHIA